MPGLDILSDKLRDDAIGQVWFEQRTKPKHPAIDAPVRPTMLFLEQMP